MAESNRKRILRDRLGDTLSVLLFTAIVLVISVFGFHLRQVKHVEANAQERPGAQLLTLSQMTEKERESAIKWYMLQDPTIPARGDSGVGFSVIPPSSAAIVPLAALPAAVDQPEKIPAIPELPALNPIPELSLLSPVDPSWETRENPDRVLLWQSDGSPLPCPGLFAALPVGKATRSTIIRIIPAGGGLSRLVLTESCGDLALDSYARQELAKLKFDTGNVITIAWPSTVRKK